MNQLTPKQKKTFTEKIRMILVFFILVTACIKTLHVLCIILTIVWLIIACIGSDSNNDSNNIHFT